MVQNSNYMQFSEFSQLQNTWAVIDLPYWWFHFVEDRQFKTRIATLVLTLTN